MEMIESDILSALQTAGIAAIAATVTPPEQPLEIKALGRTFNIPQSGKYFEFVQIINNIPGQYLGSEKTYQGVFRILLHWTLDDEGYYPPMKLLEKVAPYFTKEKRLYSGNASVQIVGEPDMTSPFESGAELIFPLSLRYRSFRP